jgi:hypothetical protein
VIRSAGLLQFIALSAACASEVQTIELADTERCLEHDKDVMCRRVTGCTTVRPLESMVTECNPTCCRATCDERTLCPTGYVCQSLQLFCEEIECSPETAHVCVDEVTVAGRSAND